MKRIICYIAIILLLVCVVGCASDKKDVKLKSEREIVRYAANKFGDASVVEVEKNEEENSAIYELEDEELGFHYSISSYASEIVIDATHTGRFEEITSDNFKEKYQSYILDQLNLENIYNRSITTNRSGNKVLFSVSLENKEADKVDISPIINKINQIDRRGYFSAYCIEVYNKDENYLGSCMIGSGEFTNCYEEFIEQMTRRFAIETNKNSGDLDGITYLYYKRIQYKDVDGFKLEWLSRENVTSDDWTTAYYFDYYGETYFMLDDEVFIDDEEDIAHIHYGKNYTNYWFIEK